MSGRVTAVRNWLLVAVGAILVALLLGWSSDGGLLLLLVAVVCLVLAVMRAAFGGVGVLLQWILRYRSVDIGLRALGDIIGEHTDDMHRAGLVVVQRRRRPLIRRKGARPPRPLPDLVPRLRHRPYENGIVVSLEAVRAGMSQDEILRALPRLRSAWGVEVIHAEALPGGRVVELTIPFGDEVDPAPAGRTVRRPEAVPDGGSEREQDGEGPPRRRHEDARPSRREPTRPPDAPPVKVVQGSERTELIVTSPPGDRPPVFRPAPALEPDERGRYELEMLPMDAARTFSPRDPEDHAASPEERNPRTAEIPVADATGADAVERSEADAAAGHDADGVAGPNDFGGRPNPTHIDERSLRLGGAQWRTGRER